MAIPIKRITILIVTCFMSLLFMACSTPLGVTEKPEITVNYIDQPSPEGLNKLLSQYRYAVKSGDIPIPGLCAEYGVLLLKAGKVQEAKKQFDLEIKNYPESQKYVEYLKTLIK